MIVFFLDSSLLKSLRSLATCGFRASIQEKILIILMEAQVS